MTAYAAIIGTKDNPVYELEMGPINEKLDRSLNSHLNQFIVHSSLDIVDQLQWTSNAFYMKTIDQFHEMYISAYVTPSNMRFMLLHQNQSADNIKLFFQELHELYIKTLMSPFYQPNQPIRSQAFDLKVRSIARRYL
ncbi:Transport protein particle 20 kDa subunit [Schizosaccharomyces pombe]|uniref:Transport protein particle 20 kDa subunit n=1 Tax=Schizosaccharomyces pombe (strain 972 / ATCC 24843) TaxID=284812 RepID=TRS20_SCHPO|nr:putative TRAPP complex subunit Trs20 [Schizosaccharomyces pombe]Q9USZ5.1 RecName: Full=Transport protein particle 20 kDa subunit; Short=TRAPP 20 kDa subunit [Schizosaccharomyces pombe 972h-]CAB59806.1 TRAPP complex subunit Trs20 (predicted) [Schizosaccharomyces pombe]|eukprot:NP_595722.1 putative TRAPP complex subunit Trs20 [Schizosaccharomyces pombe]